MDEINVINEDNNDFKASSKTNDIILDEDGDNPKTSSELNEKEISNLTSENYKSENILDDNKVKTDNHNEKGAKNTIITLQTNYITMGDNLIIYLKDTEGKPVINGNISISINNNVYNKTTDFHGVINLKLDLPANYYLMTINYAGNAAYKPAKSEFVISINKKESNIIIHTYSLVKGRNLIVQLIDSNGETLKYQNIIVSAFGTDYYLQTDDNGFSYLNINSNIGNYIVTVRYYGDYSHMPSENSFQLNVYKLNSNFAVPYTWIVKGTYFQAYLKDSEGNPITNALVKLTFKKKKFNKKTDALGRISLKINNKHGKYKLKLVYLGDNSYSACSKKLIVKSYKSKTKITVKSFSVIKGEYLSIYLKDSFNRVLPHKKLIVRLFGKNYKKTTNSEGRILIKLNKLRVYKIKVKFCGAKEYFKRTRLLKISVIKNNDIIEDKATKLYLNGNENMSYYMRLVDSNGNPIVNKAVSLRTKCHNFTSGTGRKITKKTIVLSSDNIYSKSRDKKLLKKMAKLLRAKGYKVKISGVGPNYHVSDVKKYKNVCIFSLVGGIDGGMFVDMAQSYYKKYLKKNKNQFVLGCVRSPHGVNLAKHIWLKRAHDDNYSVSSFIGLYFPGQYLNKKTMVDYVYGSTAKVLVKNFLNHARYGRSVGMYNIMPGKYSNYNLITNDDGYISIDLHLGTHSIITSYYDDFKNQLVETTEYVKVIK